MLFVGSLEKLFDCGCHEYKDNNDCQLPRACGSSLVFLWHIYEQSGDEPGKRYLRNISFGFRDFSWHGGSSDVDVAAIST